MKKIIIFITIIFNLFFILFKNSYACSIPPDILSRYYIYEENWNLKIEYSLYTWEKFKIQIEKYFQEKTKKELNKENINIFIEKYIKNISSLKLNWKEINLKFESVKFYKDLWRWNPMFEIKFSTDINWLQKENNFYLNYKKDTFSELTWLVHAYIYTEIEENLDTNWFSTFWEERYENYFFKWWEYWILSELTKEEENLIEYRLNIKKFKQKEENTKIIDKKETENPLLKNQNNLEINWFNFSNYFQSFLEKDSSIFMKIFWIIFAIIFWSLHALLPWHAKSIVWAYMMENKNLKSRKKETFILIISITLSHTFFIFLLAFLIHLLNYWVWSSTSYVWIFSSILYILFWTYFSYDAIKKIKHYKNHKKSCNCCSHWHHHSLWENKENSIKKALIAWVIFWFNPCIDALVLFIFSFSIWNIFYASLMVLAFSLWLWLMLWFLAFLVWKWYNFLSGKNSEKIQKILNILVLVLWIFIIFIWISWLIK